MNTIPLLQNHEALSDLCDQRDALQRRILSADGEAQRAEQKLQRASRTLDTLAGIARDHKAVLAAIAQREAAEAEWRAAMLRLNDLQQERIYVEDLIAATTTSVVLDMATLLSSLEQGLEKCLASLPKSAS